MEGSYLGSRGYVLLKSSLSDKELLDIKTELTVTPYTPEGYGSKPESFKNYLESNTKIYLPKYYALQKFGLPEKDKLNDGLAIDVKFNGKLRPIQEDAIKAVLNCCNAPMKMGALLCLQCGGGKCLGYDTDIIMYDGTIKKVQDIKIGDVIMGDDSKPRNILSLARGREMMYEIIQKDGSYKVNESHILSLKDIKGNILDISVKDYLKLVDNNPDKDLLGYKVQLEFESKHIDIDPYTVGYWLCSNHIPMNYKCNSREIRLNLLAGLIDYEGIYTPECEGFKLYLQNEKIIDDCLFLARSLGFLCNRRAFEVIISGCLQEIPLKKHKLVFQNHTNCDKNNLCSTIEIKKLGVNDYYGFEIDGNRRFVLGDFTVTHNTVCGISMICTLAKKTLIIAHKEFLLEQWKERIQQFAPTARLGLIKAQTIDYKDKDIVLASLQSISMKDYDEDVFKEFGTVVIDECFPYEQNIATDQGPIKIGRLYNMWKNKETLPLIKSFNIEQKIFEWKSMTYAWEKQADELLIIKFSKNNIKCTPNHKILTPSGMIEAHNLNVGDLVVSYNNNNHGMLPILSIAYTKYTNNVYDIEVTDNHNFICCGSTSLSGIIVSNCHHTSAQVFSKALRKITCKYSIGLTATPKRKDGLTKVFKWYIGDIAYESKKVKDTVEVRFHRYYNPSPDYSRVHTLYNKKPNISRMINSICEFIPRVEFLTNIILNILKEEPNRRFLILSDRRQHVELIKETLDKYKLDSGFYYGGMKQEDMKKSENCQFIIGTFQNVSEGFDCKGLDTLILGSPKGDVIQICGRILRDKPEDRKHTPLIIDIIDDFATFPNQAKKRHTYYKKCKYEIKDLDNMFVEKKKLELPKNTCLIQDFHD